MKMRLLLLLAGVAGLLPMAGLTADPKLDDHEARALEGFVAIGGEDQVTPVPGTVEHPAREPPDDVEPIPVHVEQGQLVDGETLDAADEALNELGGVGAPGPDHGYLHTHRRASYTHADELVRKVS